MPLGRRVLSRHEKNGQEMWSFAAVVRREPCQSSVVYVVDIGLGA